MQINLFNAKNPNGKRVPVSVSLEYVDLQQTNDGELVYIVSISTGARGSNGSRINTLYINNVTKTTFKEELSKALTQLAEQIDWGILQEDIYPPSITDLTPKNNDLNVHIDTDVSIELKDPFPASFINLSTLKFEVNGIDVTNELRVYEKDNKVSLSWTPIRIKD